MSADRLTHWLRAAKAVALVTVILTIIPGSLQRVGAANIYDIEHQITFNVLDRLEYSASTGQVLLIGHRDNRYNARAIPYLQHLATLLGSPAPEFSFEWTRESESQVDALFRRMDSDDEMRKIGRELGKWFDDSGNVTAAGRSFLSQLGIQPSGGSWDTADRFAKIANIFRAAGNAKAANTFEFYGKIQNAVERNDSNAQRDFRAAFVGLVFAAGKMDAYRDMNRRVQSGELADPQLTDEVFRLIATCLDEGLGLAGNPGVTAYNAARRRGSAPESAFDNGLVPEFNRQIATSTYSAMESLFNRLDEVVVPPDVLQTALHIRPEVTPEFIGVDAHSQLARVLFESDYLGKSLVNKPELQKTIALYQTEFAFERSHPVPMKSGAHSTCRIWITIDQIDVAQSPDGNVFATRGAKMRVNIQAMGATGTPPTQCSRDYANLLTSLYDDFSAKFPVLHELREAAKLAAAARWLKTQQPEFTLPQAGRTAWNAPTRTPGLLYLMWSPKPPRPGAPTIAIKAMGGVSLRLPGVPDVGPSGPVGVPVDVQLRPMAANSAAAGPSSGSGQTEQIIALALPTSPNGMPAPSLSLGRTIPSPLVSPPTREQTASTDDKNRLIAQAQNDFARFSAQVDTDRQVLRNLGFDRTIDEMESWTQYSKNAQEEYIKRAKNEGIRKFLQLFRAGMVAWASPPQITPEKAASLFELFKAAGVKDKALFNALAAAGTRQPLIPERELWVKIAEGLEHMNEAHEIAKTEHQATSILDSVLTVASWMSPEVVPYVSIVQDASWIGYATYTHAKVAYGLHQLDGLATLTEAQLKDLEPVTRRLKKDVDGLVAAKRALQQVRGASSDSTSLVRKPPD